APSSGTPTQWSISSLALPASRRGMGADHDASADVMGRVPRFNRPAWRHIAAGPPSVEIRPRVHRAPSDLPVAGAAVRRQAEMKMTRDPARVAGVADLAQRLSGKHPDARCDAGCHLGEVAAVVTDTVIADDAR